VNRNSNFLLLGSLIAGVVVLGVGLLKHGHTERPKVGACGDTAPAYWYDPMVPQQRFDKPGKSPFMDMQLVPKCGATAGAPSSSAAPDAASAERKPLYWFDPMKPQQHCDKPGKSPFMDMQLVPMRSGIRSAAGSGSPGCTRRICWRPSRSC
jgi:rubredoxin